MLASSECRTCSRARAREMTRFRAGRQQQKTHPQSRLPLTVSLFIAHARIYTHTHAHFLLSRASHPCCAHLLSLARSHSVAGNGKCAHTNVYSAPLLQFALFLSASASASATGTATAAVSFSASACASAQLSHCLRPLCCCFCSALSSFTAAALRPALLCCSSLSFFAATVYYLAAAAAVVVVRRSQGFDLYLYFADPLCVSRPLSPRSAPLSTQCFPRLLRARAESQSQSQSQSPAMFIIIRLLLSCTLLRAACLFTGCQGRFVIPLFSVSRHCLPAACCLRLLEAVQSVPLHSLPIPRPASPHLPALLCSCLSIVHK